MNKVIGIYNLNIESVKFIKIYCKSFKNYTCFCYKMYAFIYEMNKKKCLYFRIRLEDR